MMWRFIELLYGTPHTEIGRDVSLADAVLREPVLLARPIAWCSLDTLPLANASTEPGLFQASDSKNRLRRASQGCSLFGLHCRMRHDQGDWSALSVGHRIVAADRCLTWCQFIAGQETAGVSSPTMLPGMRQPAGMSRHLAAVIG
jgi:hypothetical protein